MLIEKPDVPLSEHEYILRAKQEWEHTFDAVTDLIFIIDLDHTIIRVNRAMAERCGLTAQELAGRKCFDVIHGATCYPAYCSHERLVESGEPQTIEFETEQLHGTFEAFVSPIRNDAGHIIASVHVARDVTEKRRSEQLVAAQQKQLEEFNKDLESRIAEAVAELRNKDSIIMQQCRLSAMGDLVNSIAHHWRQPLNNIGLIVQSLQLAYKSNDLTVDELDAEIADTMEILQQISDTIDDFRNFFHHEEEPCSFSVNEAVARSINFVMPSLNSKGIKVVTAGQADINVVGYPNEYAQALINIIVNARDALVESHVGKPVISISISGGDGRSSVTVLDNGGGIDEEDLPRVFDPYFTTKKSGKATGISLYMSKMIIEKNMNGCLAVRNVDGGAEFRIEV
ncbi:MAG: PAS domain-containing sensor histidine kinase [Desulfuromonadaceae bacterium]|nr:PAS domain-containing sensor histidine kinase [Desulfuromonadaceae bacterium]MDD2848985.1 PAS domain-containing sensor histidine kinase [Desulfuromonadaceae bacterium]MDD4130334.1 PAS domain-containing sensor histidine kinase [Desulfuromonadaceae bacterium]